MTKEEILDNQLFEAVKWYMGSTQDKSANQATHDTTRALTKHNVVVLDAYAQVAGFDAASKAAQAIADMWQEAAADYAKGESAGLAFVKSEADVN